MTIRSEYIFRMRVFVELVVGVRWFFSKRIVSTLLLVCASQFSLAGNVTVYEESEKDSPNPDRGFYDQILVSNTFKFFLPNSARDQKRVYLLVDRFLNDDFSEEMLDDLDRSLALAKEHGNRLILRITYHWLSSEVLAGGLKGKYAVTADGDQIIRHVRQVAPVIAKYRNVVSVVESGMIGFWGEQHGDSAEKQSPDFMRRLVDEWLKYLGPSGIPVQIRYPAAYRKFIVAEANHSVKAITAKVGLWNDCMAAFDDTLVDTSIDDLGLDKVAVEGETCQLPARTSYSCVSMVTYFKRIKIDMLHENFYAPIVNKWKADGCFSEIEKHLGYRYVIRGVRWSPDGKSVSIDIDNVGWGKSYKGRHLYLVVDGFEIDTGVNVSSWAPGSRNTVSVSLSRAPDASSDIRLRTDDNIDFSNISGNKIFFESSVSYK